MIIIYDGGCLMRLMTFKYNFISVFSVILRAIDDYFNCDFIQNNSIMSLICNALSSSELFFGL